MLPAKYYHLHYDESSGEILGFFNPMKGKVTEEPTILIDLEQHAAASANAHKFRVLGGKLVEVDDEPQTVSKPVVNVANALIAGLMVDGVCFALEPSALSVMTLDLASGGIQVRAIIHTPDGTRLEAMTREKALEVSTVIVEHLASLHCG